MIRETTYSTIEGQTSIQLFNSQVISNYIECKFGKQEIKKKIEEKFKMQEV
jgi:hypothetical protein